MAQRTLFSLLFFASLLSGQRTLAQSMQFDVALSPAGSFKAQSKKVTGTAYRTADGVAAENVVVDLNSLSTGISLRDKHTKEHLRVDKHPEAKLVKASGKNGKGKATIEVAGKTKEVEGTYKIEGNQLKAEFPMKLSDLEIKGVRYMSVGVKDDIVVHIDLPLQEAKRGTASVKKK